MDIATLFNVGLVVFFAASFAATVAAGKALKSQPFLQRKLPVFITFVIGMVMIFKFTMPTASPHYDVLEQFTQTWATIIMSFAVTLGVANLLLINAQKIYKALYGWGYNLLLLVGFIVTAGVGVVEGLDGTHFGFIFNWVYSPMNMTMFSILAFYVASAAFRAFRAKNSEATLLLVTAILVMLGRVSMGTAIWQWLFQPIAWFSPAAYAHFCAHYDISQVQIFINNTFTTAGQRAILLGASLGYISFSLKILLGIERSYFGGDQ